MSTEEELFALSDEELEAAFKDAKAHVDSDEIEEDFVAEDDVEETLEEEEIDDNDNVDELEQPSDEDSDDDTSSDEDEEDEADEDSEDEEGELDGEPDAEDEKTEDDELDANDDEQPSQEVEKLSFKANGQDYEFTIDEIKAQFGTVFGQAMDYTKKTQAIKKDRRTLDLMDQVGITYEDLNTLADMKKGDKDAIAAMLKRTGVDALDLDTENTNYVAKDYGRNDTELAIKDIVDEISDDKEYAITHNVLEKQWDDESRDAFIEEPKMIKLLHTDVKSGMFDTLNPIAQKLKVYDNGSKSDLDYYKLASQQYFESQRVAQSTADIAAAAREAKEAEAQRVADVRAKEAKRSATKKASVKRKAAAPTKKSAGTKQVDYLEDSDEEFEEWYAKLQGSM